MFGFLQKRQLPIASIIEDRSISRAVEDKLDRGVFVDNLVRALVREELDKHGRVHAARATGLVVGLTGSWGLG
jgi:hypothetical protein